MIGTHKAYCTFVCDYLCWLVGCDSEHSGCSDDGYVSGVVVVVTAEVAPDSDLLVDLVFFCWRETFKMCLGP